MVAVAYSIAAGAVQIEPPKTPTVDNYGVNLRNGQVSNTLPTVSIGGAMGLSHTISIYANEIDTVDGFKDKFVAWGEDIQLSDVASDNPHHIYRVHDSEDSADFAYYLGNTMQSDLDPTKTAGTYSYKSIGDERHTLVRSGNTLLWTKPDGTIDTFWIGSSGGDAAQSILSEIKYPNGFTITLDGLGNARTNTGFQVRRFFVDDTRGLDKPDKTWIRNVPRLPSGWYTRNPKYIRAINNAIDYCPNTGNCALTRSWPTATFDWPPGMPRTMFLNTATKSDERDGAGNVFYYDGKWSVTDPSGGTTTYYYKAYDLAYDGGAVVTGYTADQEYSPRLVGIKPPNSTGVRFTYAYKNNFDHAALFDYRLSDSGLVTNASNMNASVGYDMQGVYYTDPVHQAYSSSYVSVNRVQLKVAVPFPVGQPGSYRGAMYLMEFDQGKMYFEHLPRNFAEHFEKFQPPSEWYTYTRSNLTKIAYASGGTPNVQAQYPPDCMSTPASYCNKPIWTKDQKGNQTDYTYHPQSGQIASITSPANEQGLRAQTRYEYTQLSARYYNGGSSKITGTPIWMKTAERSCANSNYVSGACGGGDEVVTRFYYNSDNLFLTSTTVNDQKTGKILTTCFQYDIYGNQIGKTEPKGAATCN